MESYYTVSSILIANHPAMYVAIIITLHVCVQHVRCSLSSCMDTCHLVAEMYHNTETQR